MRRRGQRRGDPLEHGLAAACASSSMTTGSSSTPWVIMSVCDEREVRREDRDAVVGELDAQSASELLDGGLAHGVGDRAHAVEEREHRADQDDLAAAGDHLLQGGRDGVDDAGDVDRQAWPRCPTSACCAAWLPSPGGRRWRSRRRSGRSGRRSAATAASSEARSRTSATHPRALVACSSPARAGRRRVDVDDRHPGAPVEQFAGGGAPIPPLPPVMRTTLPARS